MQVSDLFKNNFRKARGKFRKCFLEPGKDFQYLNKTTMLADQYSVLDSVLRGNKVFYDIKSEMDSLYAKEDFSEQDVSSWIITGEV